MKRLISSVVFTAALTAASAFLTNNVNASTFTYTFTNVLLSDGGVLNGSFTTGVYGGVASWNLTTSGGSLPGETYSSPPIVINNIALPSFSSPTGVDFFSNTNGYFVTLQLMFSSNILDGGASLLTGIGGQSFECRGWNCPSDLTRYVSGFDGAPPTETPLPIALQLFAGGLGVMGLLVRRRKRKIAAALETA